MYSTGPEQCTDTSLHPFGVIVSLFLIVTSILKVRANILYGPKFPNRFTVNRAVYDVIFCFVKIGHWINLGILTWAVNSVMGGPNSTTFRDHLT